MFNNDNTLQQFDPQLAQAIKNEELRQHQHLELIASENYASALLIYPSLR